MTNYTLPDLLNIVCLADDRPRADLPVLVTLAMLEKNPFQLIFGSTDSQGRLAISKCQMEDWMKSILQMFPADYSGLDSFTGEIHVSPLGLPQIQSALKAYELYHTVVAYPPDHRNMLKKAWESLYQQSAKRLEIRDVSILPKQSNCRVHRESLNLAA